MTPEERDMVYRLAGTAIVLLLGWAIAFLMVGIH